MKLNPAATDVIWGFPSYASGPDCRSYQHEMLSLAVEWTAIVVLSRTHSLASGEKHLFWSSNRKRFKGTWEDRLDGLFSANVEYTGKSILDVGCNMGVVAYEISKLKPNSIHGIDILKSHIETAKMIFLGSDVPSRFDCINLGNRRQGRMLQPKYDIVLLLAVYHHMQRSLGAETARRVLADIVRRVHTVVARTPANKDSDLIEPLARQGFVVESNKTSPIGSHVIVFVRH